MWIAIVILFANILSQFWHATFSFEPLWYDLLCLIKFAFLLVLKLHSWQSKFASKCIAFKWSLKPALLVNSLSQAWQLYLTFSWTDFLWWNRPVFVLYYVPHILQLYLCSSCFSFTCDWRTALYDAL